MSWKAWRSCVVFEWPRKHVLVCMFVCFSLSFILSSVCIPHCTSKDDRGSGEQWSVISNTEQGIFILPHYNKRHPPSPLAHRRDVLLPLLPSKMSVVGCPCQRVKGCKEWWCRMRGSRAYMARVHAPLHYNSSIAQNARTMHPLPVIFIEFFLDRSSSLFDAQGSGPYLATIMTTHE